MKQRGSRPGAERSPPAPEAASRTAASESSRSRSSPSTGEVEHGSRPGDRAETSFSFANLRVQDDGEAHGTGAPLRAAERAAFGRYVPGRVLDAARVHEDAGAAAIAASFDAEAVTYGRDIYVGAGGEAPTYARTALLLHELAHVGQHVATSAGPGGAAPRVSHPGDHHERQADRFVAGAMAGRAPTIGSGPATPTISRRRKGEASPPAPDSENLRRFEAVLDSPSTEGGAGERVATLLAIVSALAPGEALYLVGVLFGREAPVARRFGRLHRASRRRVLQALAVAAAPLTAPQLAVGRRAVDAGPQAEPADEPAPEPWILTAETYEPPPRQPVPTQGIRLTGIRYDHMAAVGGTHYYEIELPSAMEYAEVLAFLFEKGEPPPFSVVAPLPKGSKPPTRTWLIGGPTMYWGAAQQHPQGTAFDSALRDPVRDTLQDQHVHENVAVRRADWFSQATRDTVATTGQPPQGADIKLSPSATSPVYVWREGDVWYWFDTEARTLAAFHRDPAKTSFGEKRYNDWVVQYIEQGMEPSRAMDRTVQDMKDTNIAMLGAFAMALSSASSLRKPPEVLPVIPRVGRRPQPPEVSPATVKPPDRAPPARPPEAAPVREPEPAAPARAAEPAPPKSAEPAPLAKAQNPAKPKRPAAPEKVPDAAQPAAAPYRPCFALGTLVASESGPIPIEVIGASAQVLARADGDHTAAAGHVTSVHGGSTRTWLHVHVGSQRVTCTLEHPFRVLGKGWLPARDLMAGDLLESLSGSGVAVSRVVEERLDAAVETFNLTVADAHTYFVFIGEHAVLVHNGDPPDFDRTLYWFFGNKPRARSSGPTIDTDGLSVWRTESRADVNTLFETRVNQSNRPVGDPHGFFTAAQLQEAGMVAPVTPGDGGNPLSGKLPHHSIRPAASPDPDVKLTLQEIEALDAGVKQQTTTVVKPKDLKC